MFSLFKKTNIAFVIVEYVMNTFEINYSMLSHINSHQKSQFSMLQFILKYDIQ